MNLKLSIKENSQLFNFDKNQIKNVSIMFPLHRENLTSYLSPILGQYGIKNSDFINTFVVNFHKNTNNVFVDDFNKEDLEIRGLLDYFELFIPVNLIVFKGGQYLLDPILPHVGSVYRVSFKKRRIRRRRFKLLRNWKKILQFSLFSFQLKNTEFTKIDNTLIPNLISSAKKNYLQVRNTLFRKR